MSINKRVNDIGVREIPTLIGEDLSRDSSHPRSAADS